MSAKQQKLKAIEALKSIIENALNAKEILEENLNADFLADSEPLFAEYIDNISAAHTTLLSCETGIKG